MIYKIVGTYQGQTEDIDTAETRQQAQYLLKEYKLAFGTDWFLTIKRCRKTV